MIPHTTARPITRSCGSCTACCTAQGVKSVQGTPKPPGVPCPALASCGGCSIYDARPDECATYTCLWLEGVGPIEDRPDFLGAVFEAQPHKDHPLGIVIVRTLRKGAERSARVRWTMKQFVRSRIPVGVVHNGPEGGDWEQSSTFYSEVDEIP